MGSTKEELKTLLYPLIEYPDGLDFNDFYCRARVGMVTAHVYTPLKGSFVPDT